MTSILQQQQRLLLTISELIVQLHGFVLDGQVESRGCKRLLKELRRYVKALQNNYSKSRAYPLKMISTSKDHQPCLSEIAVLIVALLIGLESRGEMLCRRSVIIDVVSRVGYIERLVKTWVNVLMYEKVGIVVSFDNETSAEHDPYLFLSLEFEDKLFAEEKAVKSVPKRPISCDGLNDLNFKRLADGYDVCGSYGGLNYVFKVN